MSRHNNSCQIILLACSLLHAVAYRSHSIITTFTSTLLTDAKTVMGTTQDKVTTNIIN